MFNVRFSKMIGNSERMIVEISDVCIGMKECPFIDDDSKKSVLSSIEPSKKLECEAEQISKSRFIASVSHGM